jgi:ubiquinone/menaquinone biosynthesis C-methylase UbiE
MAAGRRSVTIDEHASWVFNRMADVYDARPPYPAELVDALVALLPSGSERRVLDLGAGIGHLALPLAARGLSVTAVEPAKAMLERLGATAASHGLELTGLHAAAESLPLPSDCFDLAVVADAMHFLDAERAADELSRVLGQRGALAVVTVDFADTPFMRGVVQSMQSAAPRRPRDVAGAMRQVFALAETQMTTDVRFDDATPVEPDTLERILRSISFIGPAMNAQRFARFRELVLAVPGPAVWARSVRLVAGRRRSRRT